MASRTPQDAFVLQRREVWNELEALLHGSRALHRRAPHQISRFGALYRQVCSHAMYARSAGYTRDLTDFLDDLAARAHNTLYGARPYRMAAVWSVIAHEIPQALRRNLRFFLVSSALFYGPLLFAALTTIAHPAFAFAVLPEAALEGMADMYSSGFGDGRGTGADVAMAGHYVQNNIGIAFRCFATGVLFGLGSAFFLIYNGVVIGTVLGFVTHRGFAENILTFVCGHGIFELTGIVIAGAAGLQMGYALVETGGRTRLGSLRAQARDIGVLVLGAALMLLIAAGLEGFWSPSSIAAPIKWGAAVTFAALVVAYLAFAGRGATAAESPERGRGGEGAAWT